MKFTMRWFGSNDRVPLQYLRQVPGVMGVVSSLFEIPVGEVCSVEALTVLKEQVESCELRLEVIESIPIHESIKLGLPERDRYIDHYAQSIRNMGKVGVYTLCYNFMPVFDWMRTDLNTLLPDGSLVTTYIHREMEAYDLSLGIAARAAWVSGYSAEQLQTVFRLYEGVDEEALFQNLAYFLRAIVPVAADAGVSLALHPDDPPWSIFGLPRIVRDASTIQRILDVVNSPYNGVTFCTGSLGTILTNDLPAMVRQFAGRVNFVHMRNIKVTGEKDFYETEHPTQYGSVDMGAVMQALVETGYTGAIRSDHGRLIWGEDAPPALGLYDRALGTTYLLGLYEGIQRNVHS